MLRIAEVIGTLQNKRRICGGICLSLNDSTDELRRHPAIPGSIEVWGGNRSKPSLVAHALISAPKVDVLFVGHLALAPVAYALKTLGRVNAYYVILHGIEAWRKVPFINRLALKAATRIIATTRHTADVCAQLNEIRQSLFRIIPLCADERLGTPSTAFKLSGAVKLLCVARQDKSERYKGFEDIFKALRVLKPANASIHLNLIGSGGDQPRLKQVCADLGVADQVTFWGSLSDEDLAAAYHDCDIFVMPSKKEGFGIVFLEAMGQGKPCIGGNHGGTPDVIVHGESGLLVEYGDVPMLAEYIRKLADDAALRQKMGRKGRDLIEGKFSIRNFELAYEHCVFEAL
ncbi:glycosyltransferase family 4 protein [Azoarcus sp. KH32C]|uniref:glycosyltransferase family 4 protein n=1 Tax=Azoarcus sp. KH32C TaxID=748247 RepID=UPI00059FFFB5|nr:glycosyltransferase family 4 protein [Azoarcus sp. KH32C]